MKSSKVAFKNMTTPKRVILKKRSENSHFKTASQKIDILKRRPRNGHFVAQASRRGSVSRVIGAL